jgi:hypothetical protein
MDRRASDDPRRDNHSQRKLVLAGLARRPPGKGLHQDRVTSLSAGAVRWSFSELQVPWATDGEGTVVWSLSPPGSRAGVPCSRSDVRHPVGGAWQISHVSVGSGFEGLTTMTGGSF